MRQSRERSVADASENVDRSPSFELRKQVEQIVNGPGTVEERDARLGELLDAQPTEDLQNVVREGSAALHEYASVDQAKAPEGFAPGLFDRLHGS